jgi:hypothetical protein
MDFHKFSSQAIENLNFIFVYDKYLQIVKVDFGIHGIYLFLVFSCKH